MTPEPSTGLPAAAAAATVRLHRRFDLDAELAAVEQDRMTLEMAVAPIALAMANHSDLESYDLSSLRYVMWGATPVTPAVAEAVDAGADIVTFSGDKLLGGPQAGFIVGRGELIQKISRNPMKRALRLDKIRLAALEATLRLYRDPDRLAERLPTIRVLAREKSAINAMALRLLPVVAAKLGDAFTVEVVPCASQIGSGALPLETVPSAGLAIRPRAQRGVGRALDRLAAAFRRLPVPVIGRIESGAQILDLRCLEDEAAFAVNFAALDS